MVPLYDLYNHRNGNWLNIIVQVSQRVYFETWRLVFESGPNSRNELFMLLSAS